MVKPEDEEIEDEDLDLEDDLIGEEDEGDEDLEVDLEEDDEREEREEKERNKAFASMRIENKELREAQSRLESQVRNISAAPAPKSDPVSDGVPRTDAEWDALADKDWKRAVDLRSNMNAQNVIATNNQAVQNHSALEKSKSRVLERHPELDDDNSEKTRIFRQVLANNPDYVNHPNGPIYAMRDMEDHMETVLGYKHRDIVSAEKNGAQRESQRQHRIVLSGSGKAPASADHKVTLTKDEAEFCKINDLDPKEYAKTKKKLAKSGKEGMAV